MLAKWYCIETSTGVKKVQGLGEKFVAESLNRFGINWSRPKAIQTPFGKYTPDFWCESAGVFIEVKSWRTALKMIGLMSLLDNGQAKWSKTIDKVSLNKMKWVHENVAPIDIFLIEHDNDKKYHQYLDIIKEETKDFRFIYQKETFITVLRMDWYLHKRQKENAGEN